MTDTGSDRPKRVRRRRGVALPPGTRYVGRPTRWGNPYVWRPGELRAGRVQVRDRAEALARYEADLRGDPARVADVRAELRGVDLACWCPLDEPCHADVLLRVANG